MAALQIALCSGGELFQTRAVMVDARKLQRSGESHEAIHGCAKHQLLAKYTGLAEPRCRDIGGLAIQVVSFRRLQREFDAKHVNKPRTVGARGKNHGVSFHHLPRGSADSLDRVASHTCVCRSEHRPR